MTRRIPTETGIMNFQNTHTDPPNLKAGFVRHPMTFDVSGDAR
jgi:hypothetical protein